MRSTRTHSKYLHFGVSPILAERLDSLAEAAGEATSVYIRRVLFQHVRDRAAAPAVGELRAGDPLAPTTAAGVKRSLLSTQPLVARRRGAS